MNDNNNQSTPTTAPINQGPFFSAQQWYPNESAIIQQLAAKAGPYVFTADGTPMGTIHSPEINLTDPNNIIGDVKKRDDDSDKNSLDDDGSSAPLSHENGTMDDGAPRRGKKRAAESSGSNWDDTTKVRRQSHNVAEKRRRDKINDKIKELKQLLPKNDTDMSKALNKTYTVEQAIEYIRKLDAQNNSLWEQQQLLQEENRYLKLLRATYNLDEGLDKSKELEAQLLGNGVPLKTSFSAMQVPIAVQVNNTGSPTNSRPGSVLVWTTPFNNNFATQINAAAPMNKTGAVPASPGAIFTSDGTAFQFNAANANLLRQSNPMLQMAMVNSGAPGSPKSNSNVNILFDSPPKSNNSTE